jgi:hypothetical protein
MKLSLIAFLAFVGFAASLASAMAGTDLISGPVSAEEAKRLALPEGALALINDPRRIHGEHPWFSELPNAGRYFDYEIKSINDVNQLVAILGLVKGPVVLELSPNANDGTPDGKKRPTVGARLTVISQGELDAWFDRLSPEKRVTFRTEKRPVAPPVTLTLYTAHPAVDLQKLVVPAAVTLVSGVTIRDSQDAQRDSNLEKQIRRVEAYVADINKGRQAGK